MSHTLDSALAGLAEQRLELGESVLDRIKVGAIGEAAPPAWHLAENGPFDHQTSTPHAGWRAIPRSHLQ